MVVPHFSEFMSVLFMRTLTKHENTQSLPFSYDRKMAANSFFNVVVDVVIVVVLPRNSFVCLVFLI